MKLSNWDSFWIRDAQTVLFIVVAIGGALALAIALWPFLLAIVITLLFGCALLGLGYAMKRTPILRRIVFGLAAVFMTAAALVWQPRGTKNYGMPPSPTAATP